MHTNTNIYKLWHSQKGDVAIMISVMVAGLIMVISVFAVLSLRHSSVLQGVQKKSLDSLYKAEEGIEYGLYANKTKPDEGETKDVEKAPFAISVWENGNINSGKEALKKLKGAIPGENIIVTSQSNNNDNSGKIANRGVFANLPSRYFDQVSLWSIGNECDRDNQSCSLIDSGENMVAGKTYQIIVSTGDFNFSTISKAGAAVNLTEDDLQYRLVFKCGMGYSCKNSVRRIPVYDKDGKEILYWKEEVVQEIDSCCKIKNLKVGLGDNCNFENCPVETCDYMQDVNFQNGKSEMDGSVILSDWFEAPENGQGEKISLKNRQVLVQFELEKGSMAEAVINNTSLQNPGLKMCVIGDNVGQVTSFNKNIGGLTSFEIGIKK